MLINGVKEMASNALVTTRINENIKHEASEVLATMGLTVSDAVRLMLTKVAKENPYLLIYGSQMLKPLQRWKKPEKVT